MEMHQCSRCRNRKPESDFHKKKGRTKGVQDICKTCRSEYQKEWYKHNRKAQLAAAYKRSVRIRKELQQKVIAYLLEHPCVDCGEKDIVVLQFDHVRGIKKTEISRMINGAYRWEQILEEIQKCEVRCANDHIRRTSQNQKSYRCAAT